MERVPAAKLCDRHISGYDIWAKRYVARDKVRFERKLELSGEGHRFFDLVRWVSPHYLSAYLLYEGSKASASPFKGASSTANKSEYLPIPQTEIDILVPCIEADPGY